MAKQIYIDENGNENLVSGTINTGKMLPMSTTEPTSMVADRIEACETAISGLSDNGLHIAKFSFTKSINATTEATFFVTRTDFNLPTGAKVVDGYIKQYSSVNTNNYWAYACITNPTATNALQGAIYNPTNSNRNYTVLATVFYTLG